MSALLRRVAEVKVAGTVYDIARNGEHYHLVLIDEPDAYGRPVAREIELESFLDPTGKGREYASVMAARRQDLLDCLGEALEERDRLRRELEQVLSREGT